MFIGINTGLPSGSNIPVALDFLFNGISTSGATFTGGGQVAKDYLDQLVKIPSGIAAIEGAEWDSVNQVWSIPPTATTTSVRTKFGTVQEITDADWQGYLSEGARTNLLPYSEDFDNATWDKGANVVITVDQTTSPDGLATADKVAVSGSTSGYTFVRYQKFVDAGDTYSFSIFAKKGNYRYIGLRAGVDDVGEDHVVFDFDTETFPFVPQNSGEVVDYGYEQVRDGWYRLWVTATLNETIGRYFGIAISDDSGKEYLALTGTEYLYIWGAQLEQASFATSYIPTTNGTVTRPATVLEFPSAGRIREQNCALWGRVKPQAMPQNAGNDWYFGGLLDATNFFGVYDSSGSIRLRKCISGTNYIASAAYTPQAGVAFEYRALWSDKGLSIQVRESGGAWSAWDSVVDVQPVPLTDTVAIGSRGNSNHFNGNYPFLKTKFLPTKATLAEYQTYVEDEENWS